MAHHVFPAFQGSAERAIASRNWARDNYDKFMGAAGAAMVDAIERHEQRKGHTEAGSIARDSISWASDNTAV